MTTRNTGSGDWHDRKTWNDGIIPSRSTNVLLNNEGTVTLNGGGMADQVTISDPYTWLSLTNATLTLDKSLKNTGGNLRAHSGTNYVTAISNSGSMFVDAGATLKTGQYSAYNGNVAIADGGTLDARISRNLGDITLSSAGKLTTLKISGFLTTELDIRNKFYQYTGGNVFLSDSAQNLIQGSFTNINNTISGAGTIRGDIVNRAAQGVGIETGDHSAGFIRATKTNNRLILDLNSSLQNGGVIDASGAAGLLIRTQAGVKVPAKVVNTGLIAAYANSKLTLDHLDVKNAGGRILGGGAQAQLDLENTAIAGGSLETVSGSSVRAIGANKLTDVDIRIGKDLTVLSHAGLDVTGGALSIGGNLSVAGTLSFNGAFTLKSSGAKATVDGLVSGSGATLHNVNETITGTGTIKAGTLVNDAAGHIDGSLKLVVDNPLSRLTNAGSIVGATINGTVWNTGSISGGTIGGNKVTNSGTLSGVTFHTPAVSAAVFNDVNGVINASSFGHTNISNLGLIQARGPDSRVVLDGTRINHGTLSSSNGGVIAVLGHNKFETLLDVDRIGNGTTFTVGNGAELRLDHHKVAVMSLNGVAISVGGTSATTQLNLDGHWVLQSDSKITLSDSANNSLHLATLGITRGTISGAGAIEVSGLLDNQAGGIIEAKGKNDLTIKGHVENDGRLEADGGTLKVITRQAIEGGGEALATHGGTVDLSDTYQFLGSLRYHGRGTIKGPDVVPAGKISGFSTGDSYVFGKATTLKGALGTVWQANADHSSGTLAITVGSQTYATLQMVGVYSSTDFAATQVAMTDGNHIAVSFVGPLKWLKPINGNWQTATNWGPTGRFVPGAGDDALIAASGNRYTVTSTKDVTVKSLATGSDASLHIGGGTFTTIEGTARASNIGTALVERGAHFVIGGTFSQTTKGKIQAEDKGTTIDIAKGGTIAGGDLSVLDGAALNAAKGSAALTNVDVVNRATINVTHNTKLSLTDSTVAGGGSIAVDKGSTLSLSNSVVRDGKIALAGALEIVRNETLHSRVHLANGLITGGGAAATLTNNSNIAGSGAIEGDKLSFVNATSGTIAAGAGGKITIATGANAVLNRGRIEASASGMVEVTSALRNAGMVFTFGGTVNFNGAVTNGEDDIMLASGDRSGLIFKKGLANSGLVRADDEGLIDLSGTVTQSDTGKLSTQGMFTTLKLESGASITGGLIEIGDESRLRAGNATIADATLSFGEDSHLLVLAGDRLTLRNSEIDSNGDADMLGTLALVDTDLNGGVFTVRAGNGVLAMQGHVTITDTTVELERGGRIASTGTATSFTNSGLIIGAGGSLGDEHMTLVNHGTITTDALADAEVAIASRALFNGATISASVVDTTVKITSEEFINQSLGSISSGAGTVSALNLQNSGFVEATTGGQVEIQGRLINDGRVQARGGGLVEAGTFQNNGKATATGDDSLLSLGASGTTTNGGQITARNGGTVLVSKGIQNVPGGSLIADDGGTVKVLGAATGGIARINGNDSVVDFEGSTSIDTTTTAVFDDDAGHGHLALNNSRHFSGTVAGFAEGDTIDIKDVAFVAGRDSFNSATGVLSVGTGSLATRISLLGHYMAADFAFSSDGHGGTLVTGTMSADPAFA